MVGKKERRWAAAARSAGEQANHVDWLVVVEEAGWVRRRTFAHETGFYLPSHLYAIRCENVIWETGQLLDGRSVVGVGEGS